MTATTTDPSVAGSFGTSARDRLLDAGARLFYEQGIHIGIDAVCREAHVSKRSMYELFENKDDLIAASLRERTAPAYQASLLPGDDNTPPRDRILQVFKRMEGLEDKHNFRGCPFLAAAVQIKETEHPASAVARQEKDLMIEFFRHEAELGGAADAALLAQQLMLVFDGASARSVVQAQRLDNLAVETAALLLDAAGIDDPRT
ncbi:TetR/AcrR family transcriptional regulator (plasmid) [Rhodococcus erythropolis]|uniref:TetR/AcrR family transcriptional regulator n=1 Tax=Rhodococcus erythropolis TaxID=1833 RepID=UPI00406BB00E